jgi:hypothetical protein
MLAGTVNSITWILVIAVLRTVSQRATPSGDIGGPAGEAKISVPSATAIRPAAKGFDPMVVPTWLRAVQPEMPTVRTGEAVPRIAQALGKASARFFA